MFDNFPIKSIPPAPVWRRPAILLGALGGVVFVGVLAFVPNFLHPADESFAATTETPPDTSALSLLHGPLLPTHVGLAAPPAALTAHGVVVKDHASGALLFGKDVYTSRPLASITKLMSALIFLEHGPLPNTTGKVVSDAVEDTHVISGDTYTLTDLWNAALVGSSNKAILSLVDALGFERSAFVARMNEHARELGMVDTVFVDPTGLDSGNVSTASDIAILLREAMTHGEIRDAVRIPDHDVSSKEHPKKHHIWNTDWLLLGWIPHTFSEVLGGKTGYIPDGGYNVAVEVKDKQDHVLDVVVLGADTNESRFTEARDAADWVSQNFFWPK